MKLADLNYAANLGLNAMTAIALALLGFSAWKYLGDTEYQSNDLARLRVKTGSPLPKGSLPEQKPNTPTLVIAIQEECKYCRASVDFYNALMASNKNAVINVALVVGGHEAELPLAINRMGIKVNHAIASAANLESMGIPSTPAVILLDGAGAVKRAWLGLLDSVKEREVFEAANLAKPLDSKVAVTTTVVKGTKTVQNITDVLAAEMAHQPVVDVRPRKDYALEHLVRSINIPVDELEVRAPIELPSNQKLTVICSACSTCTIVMSASQGATRCDLAERILSRLGFRQLSLVADDLRLLPRLHFPLASSQSHEIATTPAIR